jgi:sn-glycerol 3-phosphate transport system permease protein
MQATQSQTRPLPQAEARLRAQRRRMREIRQFLLGMLFLIPSLVVFVVFVFYPLARSVYLSAYLTDPIGRPSVFVGFELYTDLLQSQYFRNSVWVSFKLALLIVPALLLLALGLAVLANRQIRGIGVFRLIFASSISISTAIASTIFLLMYSAQTGTLNYLLGLVGLPRIPWLLDPGSAPTAVAIATIWSSIGFNFIVLLSGMQGIPEELYESAALDGAHGWSLFRHITLPLLSPTLFFVTVVSTIGVLQAFTQIHILTKGGPSDSTYTLVYSIYEEAFLRFQFGSASAQALMLFVVMLALTVLQFQVLERRVHYE